MTEHYMTWETYEQLEEIPRWIDVHSVTCAICGQLADERETVDLWDKDDYPNGEAHLSCFEE